MAILCFSSVRVASMMAISALHYCGYLGDFRAVLGILGYLYFFVVSLHL